MAYPPIKQALIIAAGNGSRLKRSSDDETPKPLRKLLGVPIIERIIRSAACAGITSVTIVVGYQAEKMRRFLTTTDLGVVITVVENKEWQKANGVSALAAKTAMGQEPFALLMADHVFSPAALEACLADGVTRNGIKLAVDYRVTEIDDIDDATKVVCDNDGTITAIGKQLHTYTAIDTGMFCCTPALFDVLEALYRKNGNCSLSDAMQIFATEKKLIAWAFPTEAPLFWQDVDTPPAFAIAEKKLLRACIKPTDGIISRNFNRYISLFITKLLINHTRLSANSVTGLVTLVGLASGMFAAQGGYVGFLLGTLLFKLASILDGCDGEMSRLRYSRSKLGQWLDTASDNFTYVAFFIGVMLGVERSGQYPSFPFLAGATLFGVAMLMGVMFYYLIRYTDSGSLVSIQRDVENKNGIPKSVAASIASKLGFAIKRDFFATIFLLLGLIGKGPWILFLVLAGSNIGWMVLLNLRHNFFGTATAPVRDTPY